jgi:hypothetical protein
MSLGNPARAKSEDVRQAERQRLTSAGMADWFDLDNTKHCASCAYFDRKRCGLFARIMRARGSRKFRGIELPPGQRACRRYEPITKGGAPTQPEVIPHEDLPGTAQTAARRRSGAG